MQRRGLLGSKAESVLPDGYTEVSYIQHELEGAIIVITPSDCSIKNCDIYLSVTVVGPDSGERAYAGSYSGITGGTNWELYFHTLLWNQQGMEVVEHTITALGIKGTVHLKNASVSDGLTLGQYRYGRYQSVNRQHGCRIEKDGEVLRNLVPCYRNSDHEPGMYDTVTGKFYTNAGQGAFTLP